MVKRVERQPKATDYFWNLAEELLTQDSVDQGSLRGCPVRC